MSMRVIFLGTSASVPTLKRSLASLIVHRKNEQLMFDCGEGTQRQMLKADTGFHKRMKIFISHLHGDHVLGLPGLLQTMALMDREWKLQVYGPEGIAHFLQCVKEALQFGLTYPVEIYEISGPGVICKEKEYTIKVVNSNHITKSLVYILAERNRPGKFFPEKAAALGIPKGELWSKLQHGDKIKLPNGKTVKPIDVMGPPRKGRKIVYTGDTRPIKGFSKVAHEADLVIHDATLDDAYAEKAAEDGHSTPSQAAEEASKAKAKMLVLNHISARYSDTRSLLEQAQKVFKNTIVAEDFLELNIPLADD